MLTCDYIDVIISTVSVVQLEVFPMGAELWREAVVEARRQKEAVAAVAEQERVARERKMRAEQDAAEQKRLADERELQEAGKEFDMFLGDRRGLDARALLLETGERVRIYAGVRMDGCEEDLDFTAGCFKFKCTDSAGRPMVSDKPWMPDAIIRNWMRARPSLDQRRPRDFMPWFIGELDKIAERVIEKTKQK